MTIETTLRNADMPQLVGKLRDLQAIKLDVVASATKLLARNGQLILVGVGGNADTVEQALNPESVVTMSPIMLGQLAAVLKIPTDYLRRCQSERPDIFDAQVNGWIQGRFTRKFVDGEPVVETLAAPDPRKFLVRCFHNGDGTLYGRALLSDRFKVIDHFDPLVEALKAVAEADPEAEVVRCNLSETRMLVHLASPNITAAAPKLHENYRPAQPTRWRPQNRRDWRRGDLISAGILLKNSETGHGKFETSAILTQLICGNGLETTDTIARTHVGARLDEGTIAWSDETHQANLELIRRMTFDAVRTFLSVDYVEKVVRDIEAKAGVEVTNPTETIQVVTKAAGIPEAAAATVLDHFIRGGQMTAGGVMNAVTSAAQVVESADVAYDMEAAALRVLELAAKR